MRKYNDKTGLCETCQVLMSKKYFIKYHTQAECFKDEFFKKEHDRELEENWQMILTRRKEKELCSAQCVKTVTPDKSKQE